MNCPSLVRLVIFIKECQKILQSVQSPECVRNPKVFPYTSKLKAKKQSQLTNGEQQRLATIVK